MCLKAAKLTSSRSMHRVWIMLSSLRLTDMRASWEVQMELHTHARHAGEVPCPEVVSQMLAIHGFVVKSGVCHNYDPMVHDEVDIIFIRQEPPRL